MLNRRLPLILLLLAAMASSCGSPGPSSSDAGDAGVPGKDVVVNFKVVVGSEDLVCGKTYTGIGTNPNSNSYRALQTRFYVHDVQLIDASGAGVAVTLTEDQKWQNAGVALIDATDIYATGSMPTCSASEEVRNLKIVGTAPIGGEYVGLKFKVGVPAERNHLFVASQPSPLNLNEMFWTWTSGYRFMRIEGADSAGLALPGGLLHLGSTACVPADSSDPRKGATCTNQNVVDVAFPVFDLNSDKVVFDIAALFKDSDLAFNTTAPGSKGCMSDPRDPECPTMLKKLGLSFPLGDGGVEPASQQSLFTKG